MMDPILSEVSEEHPEMKFVKLNVDENISTSNAHDTLSIPALLVFVEGKIVKKLIGAMPKRRLLDELSPWLCEDKRW